MSRSELREHVFRMLFRIEFNNEEEMKEQQKLSYKERIEALTEKFKNDPVKLAVLSKLAQEVAEV